MADFLCRCFKNASKGNKFCSDEHSRKHSEERKALIHSHVYSPSVSVWETLFVLQPNPLQEGGA